jgi:chromatin remodeling complex protein RSC6
MNSVESENQEVDNIFTQFETLLNGLQIAKTHISGLQNNVKKLEKSIKKQMKGLKKEVVKSKNKGNRQPSGFAKPRKVTKELCEFMNTSEGTEVARTEVARALIKYIKDNNLQNNENGKIIEPDNKLKGLLGIEDNQELTYFNIQKYMNKHFI